MSDLFSKLRTEGPKVWRQFSPLQKATLVAVGLAAVAAIFFVTQWAQQTEYTAAFTGLSESDASAIVAKLKELKIPYELADGGATVRVPSDKVYDVRLQLVAQGLPKGGTVGFELFDRTNFGLTDFAQRLNYQRALEGELARTISRLSGVEDARVHIVLPSNELFVEREKPVTASVVLRLKPGVQLEGRQVRGVVNLVSRSVEGLKPENVTVVDGDGVVLSGQDGGPALATGTSAQQDAQRGYERMLQQDIQAMLEQVLGPRKAVVRVSATMDWDQYESSSETYSPNGKAAQVRSSREVVERSATPLGETASSFSVPTYPQGARSAAGPVSPEATPTVVATPGVQPTPVSATAVATATGATEPKYERRETTTNYELSKQVERIVKAPGAVKRLSVSVLLDGQVDDALASTISKAVSAAAGLDPSRGDSVVVASLPFDRSTTAAQEQAAEESAKRELYMAIARGALVLISLLVVLLLVRSVIKGLTKEQQLQVAHAAKQFASEPHPATLVLSKPEPSEDEMRAALIEREVSDMAKSQPKLVAQIIKSWIDEK